MLYLINDPNHNLLKFIKDDPVRPEIPLEFRVSNGRFICALSEQEQPQPDAMVCVSLHNIVPICVDDLSNISDRPTVAIFYSIWSYKPGAGRQLLMTVVNSIKERHPSITRFITLSPKTEMARKFHIKNGAIILQENEGTINYEYIM